MLITSNGSGGIATSTHWGSRPTVTVTSRRRRIAASRRGAPDTTAAPRSSTASEPSDAMRSAAAALDQRASSSPSRSCGGSAPWKPSSNASRSSTRSPSSRTPDTRTPSIRCSPFTSVDASGTSNSMPWYRSANSILAQTAPMRSSDRATGTIARSQPGSTVASLFTRATNSWSPGRPMPRLQPAAKPRLARGSSTRIDRYRSSSAIRSTTSSSDPLSTMTMSRRSARPVRCQQRVETLEGHVAAVEVQHDDPDEGVRIDGGADRRKPWAGVRLPVPDRRGFAVVDVIEPLRDGGREVLGRSGHDEHRTVAARCPSDPFGGIVGRRRSPSGRSTAPGSSLRTRRPASASSCTQR